MSSAEGSQTEDPQSLVRAIRDSSNIQENFRRLFQMYYAAVFRYFSRKGFPDEDCRDLTQEVFIGVYSGLGQLRNDQAFTAWLFTIARHTAGRHIGRTRPAKAAAAAADGSPDPIDSLPAPGADPLTRMIESEKLAAMRAAIEALPGREQDCIRGRVVDGLDYRQIGARLGISESTVGVHLHRALKSLRARLRPIFGDAPFAGDL